MRHRYLSDQSRLIPQLAGVGDWNFDTESGSWYETMDTGTAVAVPDPATAQGGDSWFTTIANAAKSIVPAVVAAKSQTDINAINLERARRGQAPLSAAYMAQMAPQVRMGLAPDTQNMLIYGGIALAAVIGLGMLSRR
jgi:hypothetical protein